MGKDWFGTMLGLLICGTLASVGAHCSNAERAQRTCSATCHPMAVEQAGPGLCECAEVADGE